MPTEPDTPVPAAALLLLRDGPDGIEVLMVSRHAASAFAAGALVFPGGKLDAADSGLRSHCPNTAHFDDLSLGLRVAAIREAFEEAGVLLARSADGTELGADIVADLRGRLVRGTFDGLVAGARLELGAAQLVAFAHWITPPDRPRRFDTRFFVAAAPGRQVAVHDGRETVGAVWITPAAALAEAAAGRQKLVIATYMNLCKLGGYASTDEAIAAARRSTIVTVIPETITTPHGPIIRIPEAAGYAQTIIPANKVTRA